MPKRSTIPDSNTVIYLGHSPIVPLIRPRSELADGLEPHARFTMTVGAVFSQRGDVGGEEVYPGGAAEWVLGGCIPGTNPAGLTLRLI